ncbi:HEPN-associated N-terminal domain-containing protein [Microtetraspora malaysiensis]|uniref:HEPN-associated N-terminal domain-containing protein n=1 Tax=Microtetraspora malaysiensis TaxID=161358 RepID=UPI003D93EFE8
MGLAKRWMEEQEAQGWVFMDGSVCRHCVDDYALEAAIEEAANTELDCDFCGRSPAAPLNVLLGLFVEGVRYEYGDADDEGVFYDGREGGYQWHEVQDTWDLIMYSFSDVLIGDGLPEAVCAAVHDRAWVPRNFIEPRRDEALNESWSSFCDEIKYRNRYVFFLREEDRDLGPGYIPPARILMEIGELLLSENLLVEIPAGRRFWRGRADSDRQATWGAKDLGTAPRTHAKQANRMSPAGIPMFYGAADVDTAIKEVLVRRPLGAKWAMATAFETTHPCVLVDFTRLPTPPSLFDAQNRHRRRPLRFLRDFVADLRKPVDDGREQIDYIPTQVVTEYLLRIFSAPNGPVAGLLYTSATENGDCAVLDVPHERCIEALDDRDDEDRLCLALVPGSLVIRAVPQPPELRPKRRFRF